MKTLVRAFIRVMALLFALGMLSSVFNNILTFVSPGLWPSPLAIVALIALIVEVALGVLAIYLAWWKTDKIARMVAGDWNDSEQLVISTTNARLYALIMSALGVYLLATALPSMAGRLAYTLYLNHYQRQLDVQVPPPTLQEIGYWTTQVLTVAIGIWLIVGRRAMAKFVNNVWEFGGVSKSSEADEEPAKPDSEPPAAAS